MLLDLSKYGSCSFARPKTPSLECVDVVISQVQSKMGLIYLPDSSKCGSGIFTCYCYYYINNNKFEKQYYYYWKKIINLIWRVKFEWQNWIKKQNFHKRNKDKIRNGYSISARPKTLGCGVNQVQNACTWWLAKSKAMWDWHACQTQVNMG
jgi:hypothetical protein